MKRIILFLFFITNTLIAQNNTYLVSQFSLGSNDDELWFNSNWYGSGMAHCPRNLSIYNNEIYIPNWKNGCISVFSLSGEHLRNISIAVEDSRYLINARIIVFSDLIYCFPASPDGLGVFDLSGDLIYYISNERYGLSLQSIVFPIDDSFLIKYIEQEPEIISNDGVLICNEHYIYKLANNNPINLLSEYENYLRENSIPFTNTRILINDLRDLRKLYSDYLQRHDNQILNENNIIENNNFSHFFLGSDSHGNLYWWSYRGGDVDYIFITNPIGKVITFFENPIDQRRPTVSPEGNLYYLNWTESKIELWKTDRDW